MSVLNQMLRNLEARGERAPAAAASDAARTPRSPLSGVAMTSGHPARRTGRMLLWGFTLVVIATSIALWQWREHQVRAAGKLPAPLGHSEFKAALSGSAATIAAPVAPVAQVAPVEMPPQANAPSPAPAATIVPSPAVATVSVAPAPIAAPLPATAGRLPDKRASAPSVAAPQPVEARVVRPSAASMSDPEADVARAAELIARGRSTDAAALLKQILTARPQHVAARRALAALQAEAGLRDAALLTLLEGAAVDPVRFAPLAASLQVELGDLAGALSTLARVPAGARTPQHHALTAGIAQRAGQHDAAMDAFRRALTANTNEPVWWIGLGVSFEALGRRAEAHAAYERATEIPTLGAELRQFAAQKLSVLAMARKPASDALVSARP